MLAPLPIVALPVEVVVVLEAVVALPLQVVVLVDEVVALLVVLLPQNPLLVVRLELLLRNLL
jgi:hypothetical protein